MLERKFIRYVALNEDYIANYGGFELKASTHSRGAGKSQTTDFFYVESGENAWQNYMAWLKRVSPKNYALVMIHLGYLELRRELWEDPGQNELDEYKKFVKAQATINEIPMRHVRQYLKVELAEISDPNSRRVEMFPIPFDFEW